MPDQRPPSLLQLVTQVVDNAKRLGQAQVALVKAELVADGAAIARTSVLGIIAIGSVSLASVFLLVTLAYVFVQLGLPTWAGFGLVTLLLLITAGVAGALAYRKAQAIKGPQQAIAELTRTQQALGISPDAAKS
jgi:hypothetical protein